MHNAFIARRTSENRSWIWHWSSLILLLTIANLVMGSGYSHFRKAQFPSIKPPMFSMSLTGRDSQSKDTLLLTYCPPEAAYVIQATLADTWPCGIRKVEDLNPSCHGIMLHECPFASKNFRDVITVKNMMAQVIAELGRQGWLPLVGCDLQTAEDISTVIFYRGSQPIFTVEVCCLAQNS